MARKQSTRCSICGLRKYRKGTYCQNCFESSKKKCRLCQKKYLIIYTTDDNLCPNCQKNVTYEICNICSNLIKTDESKLSICQHKFHFICINLWLSVEKHCPVCFPLNS